MNISNEAHKKVEAEYRDKVVSFMAGEIKIAEGQRRDARILMEKAAAHELKAVEIGEAFEEGDCSAIHAYFPHTQNS